MNGDMWNNNQYNQEPYVTTLNAQHTQERLISQIASKSLLVVFLGLIVTTISAYITVNNVTFMESLFIGNTFYILCIAEIAIVLLNSLAIRKKALGIGLGLYVLYTIINGITLSVIFLVYDLGQVQQAFLMTTLMFGVLVAFGYFTKRDLSTVGGVCYMALFGALIVTLLNVLIFHNSGVDLLMDYIIVAIFVGITAYDMWRMKQDAICGGEQEENRIALFTGIQLYLDFINIFLRILRIMSRRNN